MQTIQNVTSKFRRAGLFPTDKNVGEKERAASVVGGLLLGLFAIRTHSRFAAILSGLLGGTLFVRGMSGRCPGYGAFGFNTATPRLAKRSRTNWDEKSIDEAIDESFPASDPPSWSPSSV